ncbi:cellulose binding domain-containing protein [Streptomyces sp. KR80]|uniref:cellulose binding domain-containing protein n=1 Tax=Streptomyces sp. KR80 TaxID=3457426 RepID=UPI003FD34E0A
MTEHWDAVLCYADICTVTTADGVRLATEACARALREARELRSGSTLPLAWRPTLLRAVHDTAVTWQAREDGDRLHPELRIRLATEAARPTTARRRRPLALRAFQDMPTPDRSLLWYVEVESQPVAAVAETLSGGPAFAEAEISRVRQAFRQRCLWAHAAAVENEICRGYIRLLDVATRTPSSPSCPDLRQHLPQCDDCSEAAACLALHEGEVPGALATGLLGWGGLAYLESRRQAAADSAYGDRTAPRHRRATRGRAGWAKVAWIGALLTAAALLAFLITLIPMSSGSDVATPVAPTVSSSQENVGFETLAPVEEVSPSRSADKSRSAKPPSGAERPRPTSTTRRPKPTSTPPAPACTARYKLVNQWEDGFQADVVITYNRPLNGWQLTWFFPDMQHIYQMWNGRYWQYGPSVTVRPVDYNTQVAANQSITVGFLAKSPYRYNSAPSDFALNGRRCAM